MASRQYDMHDYKGALVVSWGIILKYIYNKYFRNVSDKMLIDQSNI